MSTTPKPDAAPTPKPPASPSSPAGASSTASLSPASESSDPAVHQLLAELQTAQSNGDEEAVKRATDALAELGYR